MDYYLYAETAFHHEGDEVYLRELIDAVAETGAKGIKFQVLINPEEFISQRHSAFKSICKWTFNFDQWGTFFQTTLDKGLDIVMMPLDMQAFHLAREFPLSYLDLHSVSFNDPVVLDGIKQSALPLILGVGGRLESEIGEKVSEFRARNIVLMTGFQAFPSNLQDVRLQRIDHYRKKYPNLSIGYADHSSYDNPHAVKSLEYAYLLGARVFEKHVTLHEGEKRTDYEAAVGIEKFGQINRNLLDLQNQLFSTQDQIMTMAQSEVRYRERQKFAVAAHKLNSGKIITASDLCLKITDEDKGISDIGNLVGKRLNVSVAADEIVTKEKVE